MTLREARRSPPEKFFESCVAFGDLEHLNDRKTVGLASSESSRRP